MILNRAWLLVLPLLLVLFMPVVRAQRESPALTAAPIAQRDPDTPRIPPRAIAYQRAQRVLGLASIAWILGGMGLMLHSGLSVRLRRAVYRTLRRPEPDPDRAPAFLPLAFYYLGYGLLLLLWGLPTGLMHLKLERDYGFGRQSVAGYLGDTLLNFGVNLVIVPLFWLGYRLYARAPKTWWKWLWALLVPLLIFQVVLQPVVFAPLYNRFTPMPPTPLREKILALAAQAGITGGRVFVDDTSRRTRHVNAYVTGLGPTTRIVLNDTAIETLPEDQLLAMMGHEMGHYVEGHIWVGTISGILGAGFFLWMVSHLLPWSIARGKARYELQGPMDLAALPLLILIIRLFLLLQAPIENAESRWLEHRADAFGLRVTRLNDATARLFVGFAERDYLDPDPPRLLYLWFGSHPNLTERIEFARTFRP